MTRLLRAELLRLTSRRLGRILALVLLGIVLLVEIRIFAVSRPELPPGAFSDPRLYARDALPAAATAVAVGCAIMGFVLGASYSGAEWHNGTMQALLFWEPRRGRVLLAKAVALVAVVVAFTVALQVVVWGLTYFVAATRGTTEGLTGSVHNAVLLRMLRGLFLVSVTSLLGFAVAGLTRVTGAALGAAFVYFAIIEQLIVGLRPGLFPYAVSANLSAFMAQHVELPTGQTLGGGRAAVTLIGYVALLLGAFYAVFTTRDVT
ncbi:MAG TPA: hypothetical protein VFQ85_01300 [Mycobacteriales bacterium]|nr:hypothetical protein [Mycobacteriales bacterium]